MGRPVGEALVEFSIAQFGGFVLSKALGWGLGRLAAEGAAKTGAQYTKSSLKLGQEMHKAYKADAVNNITTFKEFTGVKGIRPDYVDFATKTIYELKPYNPRGIQQGWKQLYNYQQRFQQKYGDYWNIVLDLY